MKNLITKFQTTVRALQLLSEPEVIASLYKKSKSQSKFSDVNTGRLIYHKHFVVQVLN